MNIQTDAKNSGKEFYSLPPFCLFVNKVCVDNLGCSIMIIIHPLHPQHLIFSFKLCHYIADFVGVVHIEICTDIRLNWIKDYHLCTDLYNCFLMHSSSILSAASDSSMTLICVQSASAASNLGLIVSSSPSSAVLTRQLLYSAPHFLRVIPWPPP